MLSPVRWEDGIPFFFTSDIDEWGVPELYGYQTYMAINNNEVQMVADYAMEWDRKLRPVHRYCRATRFAAVLSRLTMCRGIVDRDVIALAATGAKRPYTWNSIHNFLKCNQLAHLYNQIPTIMQALKSPAIIFEMTNLVFLDMVNDFKKISMNFEFVESKRKYFPSIRFIAFKLLEARGAQFVGVPFMRTKKNHAALEEIWQEIKV